MGRLVNVHYLDKVAFMTNNADILDDNEKVIVFETSPNYDEVIERVRYVLNWMDPHDRV